MRKIFVPEAKDRTADAVIIGGGIVGTATAFWLSKAGLDTMPERWEKSGSKKLEQRLQEVTLKKRKVWWRSFPGRGPL